MFHYHSASLHPFPRPQSTEIAIDNSQAKRVSFDLTSRLGVELLGGSSVCGLLTHLSPRSSQAKAAPGRAERSVRADHAARTDLAPIQRAGWCLPPAARCVILQSGPTSSGPDVLVPAERSASVCLLPRISRVRDPGASIAIGCRIRA